MELEKWILDDGLTMIVGKWQADYVVNAFSNDLAHIPATEFKSENGTDFSALSYEFFEDHTLVMKNSANGMEVKSTWEQTGIGEFRYDLNSFLDVPAGADTSIMEKLQILEGNLCMSVGFLVIGFKKVAEGVISTEEKTDIGDVQMSEADLAMNDIVGSYCVYKAMAYNGKSFGLATYDEAVAVAKSNPDNADDMLEMVEQSFGTVYEFTADHMVVAWSKIPEGVTEEEIKKAQEAGEIDEVKDGRFRRGGQPWKAVDGKYFYDTGEHREVFGEVQSSWDELKFDEEGLMDFSQGMVKLKKMQ